MRTFLIAPVLRSSIAVFGIACALVLAVGCSGSEEDAGGDSPERIPANEPARRVARLTALQFHQSLTTATGETWSGYEANARIMGRPDFLRSVNENTDLSVSFDRAVGDAARETCSRAVTNDRSRSPSDRVILRYASFEDDMTSDRVAVLRNLKYLMMRFHATRIDADDDDRLKPWLEVLRSAGDQAAGWTGVCVGLVTHPDFLTY